MTPEEKLAKAEAVLNSIYQTVTHAMINYHAKHLSKADLAAEINDVCGECFKYFHLEGVRNE